MSAMQVPTETETTETDAAEEATIQPTARARFTDSRHIRQMALAWGPVTDEMKIRVEGDGLHAIGVDAAHVLMGRLHVKPETLEGYRVKRPGETLVDVDRLLQHAKSFSLGDPARLFFNGEGSELVAQQGRVSRTSPYKDAEAVPDPKIPELVLPGEATVPDVGELFDFVKHATKETSDHLRVTVSSDEGLTLRATGDLATDEYRATVDEIEPARRFGLGEDRQVSALFSGDYLQAILKVAKKMDTGTDATVRLHVGDDYPIRVVVENGPLRASYLQAPRIE